ncbi:hypothetical protein [Pendulispora albinea]|uniref:Lipoprotein n=1 Tax=Pendulispora albinea TaxID=2741071 RepID=A0ABZ2LWK6_9BACT
MGVAIAVGAAGLLVGLGCEGAEPDTPDADTEFRDEPAALSLRSPAAAADGPRNVGLGLYFVNGVHNADFDPTRPQMLHLTDGPQRFLQELYIVSRAPTTPERGLDPVMTTGDLAALDWRGVHPDGEDWRRDSDGVHWTHQVYFRGARWMDEGSVLAIIPRDHRGDIAGTPLYLNAGRDDIWRSTDDAFERRFVARVITTGCKAKYDCSNHDASSVAEGLVQLRGALSPHNIFRIPKHCSELVVAWSADIAHGIVRRVPVVHHAPGRIGYGLRVILEEMTSPARGYYLPNEHIGIRVRYTDANGTPLFSPGSLPTYGDAYLRKRNAQGLRYLSFSDVPILYWAHKSLQADMEISFAGPLDRMTRVGTTSITPESLMLQQIPAADVEHDGYSAFVQIVPSTKIVFPCLLALQGAPGGDPSKCSAPVSDEIGFDVPADALSGTYTLQLKARREWQGEPVHAAQSIRVQVGTPEVTRFAPFPIPGVDSQCRKCHTDRAAIPVVGHGFPGLHAVGPECLSCHTSGYYFEPDADIVTRLQRMHALTHRLGPPQ